MYVELNGKQPPHEPWSFRQTGVYHKYKASSKDNRAIILHPNDAAQAQARLKSFVHPTQPSKLAEHPLNIHLVIISTYLVHWHKYIENLASELEQIVRPSKKVFGVAKLTGISGDI